MLRFGVSTPVAKDLSEFADFVARVESQGFDALYLADHIGLFDPFVALTAAAAASERLLLGTYVLNGAFWNPLLLARVAASTDILTGGRLALGIGAGHAQVEFEQAGIPYPSPTERVARLAHLAPILRALLDGERVNDEYFALKDAATGITTSQARVPLLIGGNGDRVLEVAARHADSVGLVGFTSGSGQVHSALSHWTWEGLSERASFVKAANPARSPHFDVLIQTVELTEDRAAVAGVMAERTDTEASRHLDSPFLLFGTEEQIHEHLQRLESLLGSCTVTVFANAVEQMAPHVASFRTDR